MSRVGRRRESEMEWDGAVSNRFIFVKEFKFGYFFKYRADEI